MLRSYVYARHLSLSRVSSEENYKVNILTIGKESRTGLNNHCRTQGEKQELGPWQYWLLVPALNRRLETGSLYFRNISVPCWPDLTTLASMRRIVFLFSQTTLFYWCGFQLNFLFSAHWSSPALFLNILSDLLGKSLLSASLLSVSLLLFLPSTRVRL